MLHPLLSWLISLATPMLFAAGATSIGADAAGGTSGEGTGNAGTTGGETAGAGSSEDSGISSSGGEATDAGELGTGDQSDSELSGAAEPQPDELIESEHDGRMIPAKYKDIFKANRELQDMYVAHKFFRQEFPGGLREARRYKETVENLGGEAGLKGIGEESKYLRELDARFMKRDGTVLDSLIEADQDATADLIVQGIGKLEKIAPELYQHELSKIFFGTLKAADALHGAYNMLNALGKDTPEAKEAAQALAEWYNSIRQTAAKAPERKNGQDAANDKRAQELEEREHSHRVEQVNSTVRPELLKGIETALAKEMKAFGRNAANLKAANPKMYQRIIANAMQEIKARVLSDDQFTENYTAALTVEHDVMKAVRMANAKNAKVISAAVRDIWAEFGALVGKAQPQSGPKPAPGVSVHKPAGEGFERVAKMPDRFDIDWNKSEHLVVDRQAILKNGKRVTWA